MSVVALDVRETRRMSVGMRVYVRELKRRLPAVAPDLDLRTIGTGENFTWSEQIALPIEARGADVVHYPTIFAPVVRAPHYVLTIHDLIHLRFPTLFGRATSTYYRLLVGRLARGAARICVGDERTVEDCVELLGVEADRCRVIPLGYDPAMLDTAPPPAGRPYVLYAGNHRAHKNLHTLVAAWSALPASCTLDLHLTGEDDLGVGPSNGQRRVVFLGELAPREVASAMRGARAVVHPALAEGFGLPILESLALGTPVLASQASVPLPLAPFVETFAARDVESLRTLLQAVADDPMRLRARAAEGEAIARAYTWDRFADATANVYREVLEDECT